MRTFCITLKNTPERTSKAVSHFKSLGLDVAFWYGFHGRSLGLHVSTMTPNTCGLYMTYLALFKHLQTLPDNEFMLLEDDCAFPTNFITEFARSVEMLPSDWEIVLLGMNKKWCVTEPVNQRVTRPVTDYPMNTHAWLVRRNILDVLIDNAVLDHGIDWSFSIHVYPKVKLYCFEPILAQQWNWESTLDDGSRGYGVELPWTVTT